jgi:dipeptide/tripeptide permease
LPQSAYYIIIVEGCERFCYYGLRAILLLYFMYFIGLDKDTATAGYHLFIFGCYFTPTLGAIIADGFIGRYLTLLTHSVIYFIGTVVLTITAVPQLGYKQLYV